MVKLEDVKEESSAIGMRSDGSVTIINAKRHGYESVTYEFTILTVTDCRMATSPLGWKNVERFFFSS